MSFIIVTVTMKHWNTKYYSTDIALPSAVRQLISVSLPYKKKLFEEKIKESEVPNTLI
jgi:uncharacterized ubiquitin-like protein YukD